MNPIITIFTPAYNRAHTIGRTYESLCRQTCKDFEWLVVDDGSKDNTAYRNITSLPLSAFPVASPCISIRGIGYGMVESLRFKV